MENERYSSHDNSKLKIQLTYGLLLAAVFAVGVYKIEDQTIASFIATCLVTSVYVMIFIGCDLTLRLCRALVALTDVTDRQPGENLSSILSRHFALNVTSTVILGIGTLCLLGLVIAVRRCPINYIWDFGPHVCVTSMIFSFLLVRMTYSDDGRTGSFTLDDAKGLDYGTGMAYSYYYGYLRMVLPSTGTASKGIVEKIENFEDHHNVTFPVHKLFILIPSSAYIPPNLKEASDQWMESARELEEETRNRAGNIGRTYRNNAYKIYPDGQHSSNVSPQYVVVEGASPLLTFYEVQQHNHPESATYKVYKKDIVLMFYRKLREILQSEPDTRDLCELIYYDDYDADGNKVNVAKLILERISEIKSSSA